MVSEMLILMKINCLYDVFHYFRENFGHARPWSARQGGLGEALGEKNLAKSNKIRKIKENQWKPKENQ